MFKKKVTVLTLLVVLNIMVSIVVTTFLNQPSVSSSTPEPVQTPGAVVSATDQFTINSSDYVDIPAMEIFTPFFPGGSLIVTFSAENFPAISSSATSVILRCLIDGVPAEPGEVTLRNFLITGSSRETRNSTLVFVVPEIRPGMHQVRIQGRRAGPTGGLTVRERTMTAINVR